MALQFCRGFLSSLIAPGGVGKTALRMLQFLSLATERPLTGQHVFRRCRVLLLSFEDDRRELRRRIAAACIHHRIAKEELKEWFFYAVPRKRARRAPMRRRGSVRCSRAGQGQRFANHQCGPSRARRTAAERTGDGAMTDREPMISAPPAPPIMGGDVPTIAEAKKPMRIVHARYPRLRYADRVPSDDAYADQLRLSIAALNRIARTHSGKVDTGRTVVWWMDHAETLLRSYGASGSVNEAFMAAMPPSSPRPISRSRASTQATASPLASRLAVPIPGRRGRDGAACSTARRRC